MQTSEGFPPVVRSDARVLVLGSLPGQRSLTDQEYYAHPQNAFWPIMNSIFGIHGSYTERCAGLREHKVALWDVLQASVRPGSLDADIRLETAAANDFATFLCKYPGVKQIVFNGKKAEQLFHRLVPAKAFQEVRLSGLPSTSPAYAAMRFKGKLSAWKSGLMLVQPNNERRGE
jgi:TDG/mug DNA glycosylase family protein